MKKYSTAALAVIAIVALLCGCKNTTTKPTATPVATDDIVEERTETDDNVNSGTVTDGDGVVGNGTGADGETETPAEEIVEDEDENHSARNFGEDVERRVENATDNVKESIRDGNR